jgi:hypothetical protein
MTFSFSKNAWMTLLIGVSAIGLMPPIARSQTPTPAAATTIFECIRSEPASFATVARRGDRVTTPMITWTSTLGGFTPEERCNIVSDRLSQAVANTPEGKLKNMKLTYGRVNGSSVICYVGSTTEACNNRNMLLTLRPEDRGQERAILQQMITFSIQGSGNAIQQSEGQDYAPLGEAIEAQLGESDSQTPVTSPGNITTPPVDQGI